MGNRKLKVYIKEGCVLGEVYCYLESLCHTVWLVSYVFTWYVYVHVHRDYWIFYSAYSLSVFKSVKQGSSYKKKKGAPTRGVWGHAPPGKFFI